MKVLKSLFAGVLITAILLSTVSCYFVSGQKMDSVKGTYKLTLYTRTNSYERREGYTPTTIDYVNDEERKWEDYLIVTGTSTGYYVHKDANNAAYAKEITLSYEYNKDNSLAVDYVIYNDAITVNSTLGVNKLGVNKNTLNYSKPAFDYTELFTNRPMRSEDVSVRFEKVDNAIDLSYAQSKLGSIKNYSYTAFGARGIYELTAPVSIANGEAVEFEYQYFYYVVDTSSETNTVTIHYAKEDAPTEHVSETVTFSADASLNTLQIDGANWERDPVWSNYYTRISGDLEYTLSKVSSDISESSLEWLIESKSPG